MKKAIKKSPGKKTGRPKSTGAGAPQVVRMHEPQLKAIDGWIRDTGISRPEAIRQLVDWALEHTKPKSPADAAPPLTMVKRARINEMRR